MFENIRKYIVRFFWDQPNRYKKTFKNKKNITNLRRMKFFLVFFTFMMFVNLSLQSIKDFLTYSFYFQVIIFVISLFLIYFYFKKIPEEIDVVESNQKNLFYITLVFILSWPAIRAGYFNFDDISIFLYIITIFFISAIFYIKWKLYLPIISLITSLILLLNYIFGLMYIEFFSRFLLLLNSCVFGFIISRVSYITFMENLLKLKDTENEYKSIIEKNNRLKDVLSNKKEINNDLNDELREVKEKLSFALEKAETGLWEWNIEDDRIIYNKEWAKILDYHVNKLDGRIETWRDLIHIEDKNKFDEMVNKIKAAKEKEFEFEHRLKTGDGNWKWMLAYGKVFKENEDGKPLKVVGIHKNINLIKKLEKTIENDEEKLKKILNRLPFAIMIYKNGGWQFVNKSAENLLAYSSEELMGSSNWSFIDSDYLKWFKKEKNNKRKSFHDLKVIDKKGNEKLVDFYAGKIVVGGEKSIILVAKAK